MPIPVTFSHAEAAEVLSALQTRRSNIRANVQALVRSSEGSCSFLLRALEATIATAHRCLNATELASIKLSKAIEAADGVRPAETTEAQDEPKPADPPADA